MEQNKTDTHKYLCDYTNDLRKKGLPNDEIFHSLLAEFNGTPYIWGGSSIDGSDCSGTVCACLNAIFGKRIRVTADSLYKKFFTKEAKGYDGIQAAFFLDEGGKAVHVSGYMGEGLFLNESRIEKNGGRPRTLCELKAMYPSFLMVRRKLEEKRWA